MQSEQSIPRVEFAQRLVQWFETAQRELPWRRFENACDPYRVLVSEVMLQQTTVAAVVPFYERFLTRFPTLAALAAAPLDDVLALWAGLGYYSRARNLHACARAVMERYDGVFPRDLAEVLVLPGIGRYTAGAVCSIAFDAATPIVDANVARVFARLFCLEGDLKRGVNQRRLWHEAQALVEACAAARCRPSQFNPALMELGALICVPREPRCVACPVRDYCGAYQSGRQRDLPHSVAKREPVPLHDVCACITRDGASGEPEVLLRQRPDDEKIWWRGMWELPRTTVALNETPAAALQRVLRDEVSIAAEPQSRLTTITHGVTHHHITLDCWAATVDREALATTPVHGRWTTLNDAEKLALPSSMRRLLKWLRRHHIEERQLSLL